MSSPPTDARQQTAAAFVAAQLREPKRPLGLACTACGCTRFRVFSTRKLPGEIIRVRKCRRCRRKLPTIEVPL